MPHPRELGARAVEAFLTHLAVDGRVAAPQNQAFAALLFPYRDVLRLPIALPEPAVRAKEHLHAPTVLIRAEGWCVLDVRNGCRPS